MTRKRAGLADPDWDPDVLLRLVPEQLPLIVYIYDLRLQRIIYANPRFTTLLGTRVAESLEVGATSLSDHIHANDRSAFQRNHQHYLTASDNEVIEAKYRLRSARGQWTWIRSRDVVLMRRSDGTPHLILCTAERTTRPHPRDERDSEQQERIESDQQRLRHLLELSERERRMVAYDVHDGFVQDVVGAQLGIDNMLDRLAEIDPESVPPLLRVRAFVRKAIDEARRVVSELRPATTDDGGLVESIQFLVNEAEVAHQLSVNFSFPENFPHLSPLLVRALARIVQEALNNVRRHAQTQSAKIRLTWLDDRIHLEITDRGAGFDVTSVPAGRYGLEGMRERARVFNGRTTIHSKIGWGTRITVEVPVENAPPALPKKSPPAAKRRTIKRRPLP